MSAVGFSHGLPVTVQALGEKGAVETVTPLHVVVGERAVVLVIGRNAAGEVVRMHQHEDRWVISYWYRPDRLADAIAGVEYAVGVVKGRERS